MSVRQFRGRPKKVEFSGLFLPSIAWEKKMGGLPPIEFEELPGDVGTMFRHARRKDVSTRRFADFLQELLKHPLLIAKTEPFLEALVQPDGQISDQVANQILEVLPGDWGCYLLGMRDDPDFPTAHMRRYREVEVHSKAADAALAVGDFGRTADIVCDHPNLRIYWRDEVLSALAQARDLGETLRPRLRAWLQLQISILAERAVRNAETLQAQQITGSWEFLMTGDRIQPGKHWVGMVKRLVGARSVPDLLRQLQSNITNVEALPSEITVKRWGSGSVLPPFNETLQVFIERVGARAHIHQPSVSSDQAYSAVLKAHAAATRIHHLGSMAALVETNPSDAMRQSFRWWCHYHEGLDTSHLSRSC